LWANKFEMIGLPSFLDPCWDPVYAAAADLGLSVNTHVGFANKTGNTDVRGPEWVKNYDARAEVAQTAPGGMLSNGMSMARLVTSTLAERFPDLRFVSVEAGAGYVPWVLDSLDWFWHAYGMWEQTGYKPSEVFARQCYFCFSYETSTLPLFGLYPENFLFSTDFPHDQAVYPGPCTAALGPRKHVETYYQDVPEDLARKVLAGNAAKLYGVELPDSWPV
jgi:predicted TIM-barrel fold metal-dependent hydrolase